ncbi:MAG TPA: DNA integrity scanning diadenylate cyclase DisA [Candidatus Nanoarchaeia archaeon]|nr:DNA integrity scanning diadenylate cyclase DisA [Candidatus Nanoarchaeia archaeon]
MEAELEMEKEVKEIQETIIPRQLASSKITEEEFFGVLKLIAPGTLLRASLDGALKTGRGALIAIENEQLLPLLDGGFRVNCRFTPQRLIELSKMDGAIVLSKDIKRITHANVLLTPDSKIRSVETGTRHKAAERTAKQINTLVIAISERRNDINFFYKNLKYTIKGTNEVLTKANNHLQLLEKQRDLFDKHVDKLTRLELRNHPSLQQALLVIQKGRLIQKIAEEMKKYIIEAGTEGTLLKTRLKEITAGVEKETNLVIKDYTKLDLKKSRALLESLSYEEILDNENILSMLAYEKPTQTSPIKGWRILSKTSLPESDIAAVVKASGSLGKAIHSHVNAHAETLGQEKAQLFKEEIDKIKLNQ